MKKEKIFKNASTKVVIIAAIILILIGGFFIFLTNKKIAEKKQPKTWVETFKNPIDPNTQPEKHKEVYEKIQKIVHFPVKYPTKLPEGYKLVRVDVSGGGSIAKYSAKQGDFELHEGIFEGAPGEKIRLFNGTEATFLSYFVPSKGNLNLLFFGYDSTTGAKYMIQSYNLNKQKLTEIANFILKAK